MPESDGRAPTDPVGGLSVDHVVRRAFSGPASKSILEFRVCLPDVVRKRCQLECLHPLTIEADPLENLLELGQHVAGVFFQRYPSIRTHTVGVIGVGVPGLTSTDAYHRSHAPLLLPSPAQLRIVPASLGTQEK